MPISPAHLHKSAAGWSPAGGNAGACGAGVAGSEIRPYQSEALGAQAAGWEIRAYRRG